MQAMSRLSKARSISLPFNQGDGIDRTLILFISG
jgi:hypothetical protein